MQITEGCSDIFRDSLLLFVEKFLEDYFMPRAL